MTKKPKLRTWVGLAACSIIGASFLALWALSPTRPTWDLHATPTTAWGVAMEPGRVMICQWWIDGDMTWRGIAEREARRPRYRLKNPHALYRGFREAISPEFRADGRDPAPEVDGEGPAPEVERLPFLPATATDETEYRFDVLLGNLPLPVPHLRFRTETWPTPPQEDHSGWTLTYRYAILPLWALPWIFLGWPIAVTVRRMLQRRNRSF